MIRSIGIAAAVVMALGSTASGDTLEISGTVQQNYQDFLNRVKGGDNAAWTGCAGPWEARPPIRIQVARE